ncbi:metal-dependent hydrolase [Patescibacteria group bacterium]|nr:metal-dependent hydrolase [Patescibacteria group bacterium]
MILAHGPGSFITTYLTRGWWGKKLSQKKKYVFYLIGGLIGVAVDLDFLYTQFLSAKLSHHDYITHTPLFFLILFLLMTLIGYATKKEEISAFAKVFLVSTFTHLVLDSVNGGIMWLYPLSKQLIGIPSIPFITDSFFTRDALFIRISIEIVIIWFAFVLLLTLFKEKTKKKYLLPLAILSALLCLLCIGGLYLHTQKTYRIGGNQALNDDDLDSIANRTDFDMDGDGIDNLFDADANNNGNLNKDDMVFALPFMKGVRYDFTNGQYYEITKRAGYFNKKDVVDRALGHAGIFLRHEMVRDFEDNPSGYIGDASDPGFTANIQNIYVFFEHAGLLVDDAYKPGDILFFGEGFTSTGVVYSAEGSSVIVMYLDDKRDGGFYELSDILEWNGNVSGHARVPM